MSGEANDDAAVFLAELASGAGFFAGFIDSSRANDSSATGWGLKCLRCCGGQDNDYRRNVECGEVVRMLQVVGGQVDCESVPVRILDCFPIGFGVRRIDDRLVCIGKAPLASVCLYQIGKLFCIDLITLSWEVSGLIVPPDLTGWEIGNCLAEFGEFQSLVLYLLPNEGKRAGLGIATFGFQRTCWRASVCVGCRYRDGAGFFV